MSGSNLGSLAYAFPASQEEGAAALDLTLDDWYLYDHVPKQGESVRLIHLHFSDQAGPAVQRLVKQYAFWRLGRVRPVTVRLELVGRISYWEHFLHLKNITDPAQFTAEDYGTFRFWLSAAGCHRDRCERILATVHLLLQTGQRLGWRVTAQKLPRRWDSWLQPVPKTCEEGAAQPIPPDIYRQIIDHAREHETNEITRCGILVQSQTGLRISEVLSLQADCLRSGCDGRWRLVYQLKKTQRGDPVLRETPANAIVCEAVGRLRQATETLRTESGRAELFLVRNHGIRPPSQTNWNRGRLQNFMERWDIRDADGHIYELHSHQFRATYATRQLLAGEPVEQIQHNLGHVTAEMTMRYMHPEPLQMQIYLESYIGCGEVWQS